jgi:hypothetical protein
MKESGETVNITSDLDAYNFFKKHKSIVEKIANYENIQSILNKNTTFDHNKF